MPHQAGERIAEECAYLKNITPIGFLSEGNFDRYKIESVTPESDLANPFAYWLSEKLNFHQIRSEFDGQVSHVTTVPAEEVAA